jgi:mRNA interferase RelE/StbE
VRYRLSIGKSAQRDLDNLPNSVFRLVDKKILSLEIDPRPRGCVKLKGKLSDYYRIRQGDFRIIYEIDDTMRVVTIHEVTNRREVYR